MELSAALNQDDVEIWLMEEQRAQVERGKSLRIYDVRQENGRPL
jgi:hypothetical protein